MNTPAQIIDLAKRTSRSGIAGNNADQTALDLLKCLNMRLREVWRFHDWEYSLDDILLTISSVNYNVTLAATTGQVLELGVQGQQGLLKKYTRKQYLQWEKGNDSTQPGSLRGYAPLGLDAAGAIKLRFFAPPYNQTVVEGWGKKKLVTITTADWLTAIAYFPEEALDVVYAFVLSDAYKLMGDAEWKNQLSVADRMLKELRGEVVAEPDDDNGEPPPDALVFRARARRAGRTV